MDAAALAEVIARAKEQDPMSNGEVTTVPGRLLLADGDGLCYYCAGNDDTAPGQARLNLIDKVRSAARAAGAERIKIVTTAQGSHKGYRYAVARVKPYQGQRDGARRPKNWQYLRSVLDEGNLGDIEVEFTSIAEADDLFSRYAMNHPDCVIFTQDKDMRMVPGKHLDWLTHLLFTVQPNDWAVWHNEKLWGRAWFWSQMLHGDSADNIPGLPFYTDGSVNKSGLNKGEIKQIKVGEKSAAVVDMLPKVHSDLGDSLLLQGLYRTCYGKRWLVEMLEQAVLLWMRNDMHSSPFNVAEKGNPFYHLSDHEDYSAARDEILMRIAKAVTHAPIQEPGEEEGGCEGVLCSEPGEEDSAECGVAEEQSRSHNAQEREGPGEGEGPVMHDPQIGHRDSIALPNSGDATGTLPYWLRVLLSKP